MTREEYVSKLLENYSLVNVLSTKNDCRVLRLRNKKLKKDLVLRSYPESIMAYEELYKIKCDNLPTVYDVLECDDGQIVLEEYIEGVTVSQVMEVGHYHYFGVRKIIREVCKALGILHERQLVHRDVKPENIIISEDGRVVLVDFNATRKITNAGKDTVVMGTVGYVSPEQLGITQSDCRTDIYAVGVLLNVMMIGKHPSEVLAKGKVGRIVRKCTNINPDERFPNVKKLSDAL